MSHRTLQQRLAALEAASSPQVVGSWDIRDAGTAALVETSGTDEALPVDLWKQRYPGGLLVTIEYESEHEGA